MNWWIPKNNLLKFMIGLGAASVIVYLVGLVWVSRQAGQVRDHYINSQSSSLNQDRILKIKSISEMHKEEIQTLRQFFTQKGDEVEFIEQIETVARTSNIKFKIDSIDIVKGVSEAVKEDVLIKISVQGPWPNVIKFVDSLEKMTFGTSVVNLKLDLLAGGEWGGGVDLIVFREK